jgi:hypothetical protein
MVTLTNQYTPRYVGNLSKPLTHQFVDMSDPPQPYPLTGVNAANMILTMVQGSTVKTGGGSWTIDDATSGIASYHWVANDVKDAGVWQIQASVPFSDGYQDFSIMEIEFIVPLKLRT